MLDLEEIDKDLYRSKRLWLPSGARGVFGKVNVHEDDQPRLYTIL